MFPTVSGSTCAGSLTPRVSACSSTSFRSRPARTREEAFGGGEDYELIFVDPDPDRVEAVFADRGLRAPVRVGTTTADRAAFHQNGVKLDPAGYVHHLG